MLLIALSTTDSEFMAACMASCEIKFLCQFLDALGFTQKNLTCLYKDKAPVIYLASYPGLCPRTKHIDVKYFYLIKLVQAGDIQVIKHPGSCTDGS